MKIINLCYHDFGGGAYCLSHAINKVTKHQAINLRSTGDYLSFPTIASMADYTVSECRRMIYKADVVIYHTVIQPYFDGLQLDPAKLRDKKNILFFHGTEIRGQGTELNPFGAGLLKEADELLGEGNYQILVSTPDLLYHTPEGAKWLPTVRSFTEIRQQYALCNQDTRALETFIPSKKKVVFAHAPTHERKKGSSLFYRVMTQLIKTMPQVHFLTIRHQPWSRVLQLFRSIDVIFDKNPPVEDTSYGNIAVEASVFKIPTVTKLTPKMIKLLKQETGLDSPFVTFDDEVDLTSRVLRLAQDHKLRRMLGNVAYKYCKAVHDEKPVVERFFKILEEMN